MTFRHVAYLRIDCPPAGQPRAYRPPGSRHMVTDWTYRKGPNKGRYRPAWYFRQAVKAAATNAVGEILLSCPVRLTVTAYFARPKRLMVCRAPDGPIPHIVVPDEDNVLKLVKDGINDAVRFWRDDCIVFSGHCEKYYVSRGHAPGAGILIEALDDE